MGVVVFYCLLERSLLPLIVVACALLHEMGHLAAMHVCKVPVDTFEIKAIGFRILSGSTYVGYKQDIAVALGGPAVNLICAAVLLLFAAVVHRGENTMFAVAVNLALFAVNMLPVRILDGGRALYAVIANKAGFEAAERIMPKVSFLSALAVTLVGALVFAISKFNFSLLIIGIYLMVSGSRT